MRTAGSRFFRILLLWVPSAKFRRNHSDLFWPREGGLPSGPARSAETIGICLTHRDVVRFTAEPLRELRMKSS